MGIPFAYTGTPGFYFYSLGNYGTASLPREVSPNVGFGPGSIKADIPDEIPAFLWTTPWTLFGATLCRARRPAGGAGQSLWRDSRPRLGDERAWRPAQHAHQPINLSWHLPHGWYVGAGFNVHAADARVGGINGLDRAGQPYWTLEPTMGVSYLHDGFDLSATFFYDFYTTNTYSGVTNGQALYLDLTATKKFGPYEIGPVAYVAAQTTRDSGGNPAAFLATRGLANSCEPEPGNIYNYCVRAAKAGVGGKVGYDFGPRRNRAARDAIRAQPWPGRLGWLAHLDAILFQALWRRRRAAAARAAARGLLR